MNESMPGSRHAWWYEHCPRCRAETEHLTVIGGCSRCREIKDTLAELNDRRRDVTIHGPHASVFMKSATIQVLDWGCEVSCAGAAATIMIEAISEIADDGDATGIGVH